MKTFPCTVHWAFGTFLDMVAITSPKTGRILILKEGSFKYCEKLIWKIQAAIPSGISGTVHLTIPELKLFLEATELAREDYKESLSRSDDGDKCIASEETDGECPHCEEKILNRQDRTFILTNYEGGL